jgi:two-component system chemotaxis response regulator CheB
MTADIRVLVIDDSAYNRQTITTMLEATPGIRVVARAGDGDEGLKQVFAHAPDVITLDLEMPRMDGFTFLRILMTRRPTPVLVISSYARKDNVFKALELGALDFIAKPTHKVSTELAGIEAELVAKVRLVAQLRMVSLAERARERVVATPAPPADPAPVPAHLRRLVVIGASTGGPPALAQVLGALDPALPMAVLVVQHMPAKFTAAFAERLDRGSALEVREARAGDLVRPGLALVAPGAGIMTVARTHEGGLRIDVEPPGPDARFVPSIDRLFESAAAAAGPDVLAVVLTGMAGEGGAGVRAVVERGGVAIAESAESAVMFGMPEEAIRTGLVSEVIPLAAIPAAIAKRVRG